MVIIDDLDKLDLSVVETIYRDNVKALFSSAFRIVFTMPVSAIRESYIMRTLKSESVALVQFPVTKFSHVRIVIIPEPNLMQEN